MMRAVGVMLTNVCSLDHANVVTTVADTAYPPARMSADEAGNIGLLCRRASACYHRR